MEISSHYYALLALCRTCGVNKETSHKIAYASQFVDDAKINCLTSDNGFDIKNIATCHSYFKIKTYNFQAMLANTTAFHFIPACKGSSFAEKLICKEDSTIINQIIDKYLHREPEMFGMLMHIYADTFAHQEFSGLLSKENDIEYLENKNLILFQDGYTSWNGLKNGVLNLIDQWQVTKKLNKEKDLDDFIPAYGHGQAKHYPDIPYLKWSYSYSMDRCGSKKQETQKISNIDRFKKAFSKIKEKLEMYLEKHPDFKDNDFNIEKHKKVLNEFFQVLEARESTPDKIKSWQNFLVKNEYLNENTDKDILTYDEVIWLKELIKDYDHSQKLHEKRKVDMVKLVDGFEKCSWLKYSVGVKNYKETLKLLCLNEGLDLHYENY